MRLGDRSITRLTAILGVLALAACSDEADPIDAAVAPDAALAPDGSSIDAEAPDAEVPDVSSIDAEPPDAGPPDSGTLDAGSTFHEASCRDGCPDGCAPGLCVSTTSEDFCVDRCDADLSGCLAGFSCVDIGGEGPPLFVCVPPAGTCEPRGVGYGTTCSGDTSACPPERELCQGDRQAVGYCTDLCTSDATCPPGWACGAGDDGERVCIPRYATGAERCGQEGAATERPCGWDGDCPEGLWCVGPAPGRIGVCSDSAILDGRCAPGFAPRLGGDGDLRCVTERCACRGALPLPAGTRDLLAEALAQVGLDRCTAIHQVQELVANTADILGDPYRLRAVTPLLGEPWRIPSWATAQVAALEAPVTAAARGPAGQAAEVLLAQATLGETPATLRALEPVDPIDPLTDAVARFITEAGGTPDRPAIAADASDLSPAQQLAFARVVEGTRQALLARRAAFARASAASLAQLYDYGPAFVVRRADGLGISPANERVRTLLTQTIDYGALAAGAATVLSAIDEAGLVALAPTGTTTVATSTATLLFSQDTPVGRIALGGPDSGLYDERIPGMGGAWALLVDLGGHDTYRIAAGGNTSVNNPVSVLVDLGGRDRYGYVEVPHPLDGMRLVSDDGGRYTPTSSTDGGPVSLSEHPRQGGARAGVAVLVDLGVDDDVYRAHRLSQGAAAFGAGVLVDEGGDDSYVGEAMVQGAAAFGYALHLDGGGHDTRSAYTFAQGFSFARAVGVALDGGGDDRWLMDVGDPAQGGDPMYPSAQRPTTSNATLGQGFAFGRRADFSDGAHMSGGIAVLLDRAGADVYRGSVFAQGGGFWFGTGILADRAGDDRYDGLWYHGGAGAHYAIGLLLDAAGDDTYGRDIPPLNVTLGGGHDWSAAFLVDEAGDDDYGGSRITLGAGNANGFGFFADNAGDDTYDMLSATYGQGAAGLRDEALRAPGSARRKVDTVGVFIDAGGRDTYRAAGMSSPDAADDRAWRHSESPEPEIRATERGSGVDGVGDSTLHAR